MYFIIAIAVFLVISLAISLNVIRSLKENLYRKEVDYQALKKNLDDQRALYEERLVEAKCTKESLRDTLNALSHEALKGFYKTLETEKEGQVTQLMRPVQESLKRLGEGMQSLEKERVKESSALTEQLKALVQSEQSLRKETGNLVNALRRPQVRGLWGEMQLKTVVELAGMLEYCNFFEQQVHSAEVVLRPDLIVRLPNEKQVIVDAKAPFEAFLEANSLEDRKLQEEKLQQHAKHLRQHVLSLSKKSYWEKFTPSPEFVVLFLPTEIFFSAALQYDPSLIEVGAQKGVIIATPTTLIGLLKAIGHGWKQDRWSRQAQEISALGNELYKRLLDMNKHFTSLGKSLSSSVESYNRAMGSLDRRVLVTARKFGEMGTAHSETPLEIQPIEKLPR